MTINSSGKMRQTSEKSALNGKPVPRHSTTNVSEPTPEQSSAT